jgi:hypothetical protein
MSQLLVGQAHLIFFLLLDVLEEASLVYGVLLLLWGFVRKLVEVFWASERNTHFQEDALDDALLLLIKGVNDISLDKFLALLSIRTLHTEVEAHGEDLNQGLL